MAKVRNAVIVYRSSLLESSSAQIKKIRSYLRKNNLAEVGQIDTGDSCTDLFEVLSDTSIKGVKVDVIVALTEESITARLRSFEEYCDWFRFLNVHNVTYAVVNGSGGASAEMLSAISQLYDSWRDSRKVLKSENARASRMKAQDRGHKTGRKKLRDDDAIHKLRQEGCTYRQIATKLAISVASVQRSLQARSPTHQTKNHDGRPIESGI